MYYNDNTYVVNADGSMSPVPHYVAPAVIGGPGKTWKFDNNDPAFVLNADGSVSPGSTGPATIKYLPLKSESNPLTPPTSRGLPLKFP